MSAGTEFLSSCEVFLAVLQYLLVKALTTKATGHTIPHIFITDT